MADRVSVSSKPSPLALVGVALISTALLALEITLTRVFSVKMGLVVYLGALLFSRCGVRESVAGLCNALS